MYSYVATSVKPTAVHHALVCQFTSSNDKNLIIGRGNHIEVHIFKENGLEQEQDISLFGRISSLAYYRPTGLDQDVLFVLMDRKTFCILGYDNMNHKFITRASGNLKDRVGRELEYGYRTTVDPDGRMIGISIYQGSFKILPISGQNLKEAFNVRLEMLTYSDIKFLHGCPRPTLCILFEDNRRGKHIRTQIVDQREKELQNGPWQHDNLDSTAHTLIPVPSPINGVIVVGDRVIMYLNGSGTLQSVVTDTSRIVTYCSIDTDGSRYLLGDINGVLYVLVLNTVNNNGIISLRSLAFDRVGITSIAENLCYLSNGLLYVGSVFGNSQLIKLHPSSDTTAASATATATANSAVEVLEVYPNIGPIVDMCVVQAERKGQNRVVTCSGAFKDGSLRVISSGVGIQEQSSIDMPGIKGIWTLQGNLSATDQDNTQPYDKYIILSFVGETRFLVNENNEIGESEIPGFQSDISTVYAANTGVNSLLQVTASGLRIVDITSLKLISEITTSSQLPVTVATSTESMIVYASAGGHATTVAVNAISGQKSLTLTQHSTIQMDQDIACASIYSFNLEKFKLPTDQSSMDVSEDVDRKSLLTVVAFGMWTDNTVRLLAYPTLGELCRVTLGTDAQARSVLITELDCGAFLFVGLGDGTLLYYQIINNNGVWSLENKKKVVLGTRAISLVTFNNAATGSRCVFVASDCPSVIYIYSNKLLFSPVNAKDVTNVVPFHTELFPNHLALISDDGLLIGNIDEIKKVHIQTIMLNETPRRIAYLNTQGVFAVCTEKVTKVIGGREIENNVLFLDEDTMIPFHSFTLDQYEDSLSCATMKLSLGDIHTADTAATGLNTIEEYVVIGTCYIVPNEQEPSQGRLLVFQVETNSEGGRIVTLVAEKDTKGPVYSLAEMNTKLVAGVNHKVQVFNLVRGEAIQSSSGTSVTAPVSELVLECAVAGQLMCLYLKTDCDKILVGDLLRSMTLLQYKPPIATTSTTATTTTTIGNSGSVPSNQRESKINGTLVEVCRHYSTDSLRSVEILKDTAENIYLGADSDGNLYTTRQVMDAPTEEEKGKMEPHGYFNLGDIVNVIKQGSLTGPLFETSSSSSGVAEMASSHTKADIICTTSNPDDLMKIDSMNNESSVLVATNRTVNSNVLIGSVTGGLYSVVGIDHDAFTFFHAVEKAVTYLTVGIGGFSHEDFRSFCNDRRSQAQRGFIDGDLVERVLDLSPTDVEAITRRVNDDLTGLVSATATASVDTGTAVGGGVVYSVDDFLRKIEDIARQH